MREQLKAGVVALAIVAVTPALFACGDKFLVTARGTRFQRAGFVRPQASVLLYASPSGRLATAVTALALPGALSKVGYVPVVADTQAALEQQLRDRPWDVVVLDLADSDVVRPRLAGVPAALVAVTYDASGAAMKDARRRHDGVVRRPGRASAVVDAVDDVLFERALKARGNARR